ncbi:MAG TPA: sugar phosphate isomerase/epimerase family protein [Verrucomicrobiales bacterium]|nr:sugar phosphate isomerase/epimerase family protein [Verrucomicrobiales bacterium]
MFPPLSIHAITNKPWPVERCVSEYAKAGIGGITLWRYNFEGRSPSSVGQMIRDAGLVCTGLARGGFFPASTAEKRAAAIDDNKRAIDEAAASGAPVLVLVCGAVPGQSLEASRGQVTEGIAACLDHARAAGVKLAIEPLHPMYADDRSAIVTTAQANDVCDALGSPPEVGIALDVYHTWWDAALESEIARAGKAGRLFSFHVCDWKTPTTDWLNDRGLMGEGCIDIRRIKSWVHAAGFSGFDEVEIFSTRWWAADQNDYLTKITAAWKEHCLLSP